VTQDSQSYLRARAEGILGDNQHEAATAYWIEFDLAISTLLSSTMRLLGGTYRTADDSVNVPALLMRVMEIIQKHVQDAEVVGNIADEFLTLASGVGIGLENRRVGVLEGGVIDL
jgi:hypothetical protein